MAEELLVDDQIDGGQEIIDQLLADGVDVVAAFWAKDDEGHWRLYIASPRFDDRKPGENYRGIRDSLMKVPDPEAHFWPMSLINDRNPAAREALRIAGRPGKKDGSRYQGRKLGDLPIEEAHIYPRPAVPLRQSFTITYIRPEGSNEWSATTQAEELYRDVRPKGAVSYSTAFREGEKPEDQSFAMIHVLVEVNPSFDERTIAANPMILRKLAEQARSLADEMFRQRHPEATIDHDEDLAPV